MMIRLHQQQKERKTNGFPNKQTKNANTTYNGALPENLFKQQNQPREETNMHALHACNHAV
jgi:hypothetical protein